MHVVSILPLRILCNITPILPGHIQTPHSIRSMDVWVSNLKMISESAGECLLFRSAFDAVIFIFMFGIDWWGLRRRTLYARGFTPQPTYSSDNRRGQHRERRALDLIFSCIPTSQQGEG